MTEMIERGARALYEDGRRGNQRDSYPWDQAHDEVAARYRASARAVLAAIREPTEAMLSAGGDAVYGQDPESGSNTVAASAFTAMIDAALGGK